MRRFWQRRVDPPEYLFPFGGWLTEYRSTHTNINWLLPLQLNQELLSIIRVYRRVVGLLSVPSLLLTHFLLSRSLLCRCLKYTPNSYSGSRRPLSPPFALPLFFLLLFFFFKKKKERKTKMTKESGPGTGTYIYLSSLKRLITRCWPVKESSKVEDSNYGPLSVTCECTSTHWGCLGDGYYAKLPPGDELGVYFGLRRGIPSGLGYGEKHTHTN